MRINPQQKETMNVNSVLPHFVPVLFGNRHTVDRNLMNVNNVVKFSVDTVLIKHRKELRKGILLKSTSTQSSL